jgi:hypothetical protein
MLDNFEKSESGLLLPKVGLDGVFDVLHVRGGEVIDEFLSDNIVVNEGLDYILGAAMDGGSTPVILNWYIGIFETNYTPLATDTAATISTNSVESSAYTEGLRQAFTDAGVANQVIDNYAAKATFNINATKTIYGAFMHSNSAINGNTGTLIAASNFGAGRSVIAGDQLLIGYRLNAQDV